MEIVNSPSVLCSGAATRYRIHLVWTEQIKNNRGLEKIIINSWYKMMCSDKCLWSLSWENRCMARRSYVSSVRGRPASFASRIQREKQFFESGSCLDFRRTEQKSHAFTFYMIYSTCALDLQHPLLLMTQQFSAEKGRGSCSKHFAHCCCSLDTQALVGKLPCDILYTCAIIR